MNSHINRNKGILFLALSLILALGAGLFLWPNAVKQLSSDLLSQPAQVIQPEAPNFAVMQDRKTIALKYAQYDVKTLRVIISLDGTAVYNSSSEIVNSIKANANKYVTCTYSINDFNNNAKTGTGACAALASRSDFVMKLTFSDLSLSDRNIALTYNNSKDVTSYAKTVKVMKAVPNAPLARIDSSTDVTVDVKNAQQVFLGYASNLSQNSDDIRRDIILGIGEWKKCLYDNALNLKAGSAVGTSGCEATIKAVSGTMASFSFRNAWFANKKLVAVTVDTVTAEVSLANVMQPTSLDPGRMIFVPPTFTLVDGKLALQPTDKAYSYTIAFTNGIVKDINSDKMLSLMKTSDPQVGGCKYIAKTIYGNGITSDGMCQLNFTAKGDNFLLDFPNLPKDGRSFTVFFTDAENEGSSSFLSPLVLMPAEVKPVSASTTAVAASGTIVSKPLNVYSDVKPKQLSFDFQEKNSNDDTIIVAYTEDLKTTKAGDLLSSYFMGTTGVPKITTCSFPISKLPKSAGKVYTPTGCAITVSVDEVGSYILSFNKLKRNVMATVMTGKLPGVVMPTDIVLIKAR